MNVSLPSPLEDFVRRKVAAGEFETVDEVVCEALRLLQQQELSKAEVRDKIEVGWEQANSGQVRTPEETQRNIAARKEAWKQAKGR